MSCIALRFFGEYEQILSSLTGYLFMATCLASPMLCLSVIVMSTSATVKYLLGLPGARGKGDVHASDVRP
jgi:hypothetical protein